VLLRGWVDGEPGFGSDIGGGGRCFVTGLAASGRFQVTSLIIIRVVNFRLGAPASSGKLTPVARVASLGSRDFSESSSAEALRLSRLFSPPANGGPLYTYIAHDVDLQTTLHVSTEIASQPAETRASSPHIDLMADAKGSTQKCASVSGIMTGAPATRPASVTMTACAGVIDSVILLSRTPARACIQALSYAARVCSSMSTVYLKGFSSEVSVARRAKHEELRV